MPNQQYDSSLKALIQENPAEIIPHLVPGAVFERVLDVEVIRPTMRADRVFQVKLEGEPYVLDIEFETGEDKQMALRLLKYHAVLQQTHELPVLSVVVYPFEVEMAQSPLQTKRGKRDNITFHFDTVPLWKMQAHQYVHDHVIAMYALLPTMEGADEDLLLQAIEELGKAYQSDTEKLANQLIWMGILLGRSSTVPLAMKGTVQRRLDMFEQLWEQDPRVQEIMAKSEAKGEARGEAHGEARGEARGRIAGKVEIVFSMIKKRFPDVAEEAQQKVRRIQSPEKLDELADFTMTAPDEKSFLWVLDRLSVA